MCMYIHIYVCIHITKPRKYPAYSASSISSVSSLCIDILKVSCEKVDVFSFQNAGVYRDPLGELVGTVFACAFMRGVEMKV